MDIDNLNPKMTLERQAFGYATRQALRRERAFYTSEHRVFVLIVPEGLSLLDYQLAASLMLTAANLKERYTIAVPEETKRGGVDFNPVRLALEKKKSALILVESRMEIPRFVIAAADAVREIGPLKPHHLAAATKAFHALAMTKGQATKLLQYPLDELFAAIRPDRPIADAIERLEAADRHSKAAGIARQGPTFRLETLSGYGDAQRWGLNLATDLAQWRVGDLEWRDVDAGVLLSGPPGTGKTLFASALAATCGVPLVATSAAQWQACGHLGDMLAAMRKSFADADSRRPCILLIDEIDSIGDRTKFSGHSRQYCVEVVNALLECMDGSDRREGVVVVGATNHADAIDAALRRSGRLDSHYRLELPDLESRKGIIDTQFDGLLSDEEAAVVAEATEGYSGADFVKLARDARRTARKKAKQVTVDHILAALPRPIPLLGEGRRQVAVHEVGHAAIGLLTGFAKLIRVEISTEMRPGARLVGGVTHFERKQWSVRTRETYLAEIAMNLGGMAAEEVILGTMSDGSGGTEGSDIQAATDIATFMEAQLGMGEGISHFRAETSLELEALRRSNPLIGARVERVLLGQLNRVKQMIAERRPAIEATADALEKAGALNGEEVARMLSEDSPPTDEGSVRRG